MTRVQRISVSLPLDVFDGLEALVAARGCESRSTVVSELVRGELVKLRLANPQEVMAGSITLVYDEQRSGLPEKLAAVIRRNSKEVVTSLSVMLEGSMRMEVLIVQGPVKALEVLLQDLVALKGVETGKLTLTTAVLPPLHERPEISRRNP